MCLLLLSTTLAIDKTCNNISDLFASVFTYFSSEDVETFAYLCWLCWGERNNVWHVKTKLKEPVFLVSHAQSLLREYKRANAHDAVQKVDRNRKRKWFPLPEGYYKLMLLFITLMLLFITPKEDED